MARATPDPQPRHRVYAALYDRILKTSDDVVLPLRDFAAGGAIGRVLEIGGGTGANLAHYDWAAVSSLDIIEPDPFMLRRAAERASELDPAVRGRVELHAAAAERLPFDDELFDSAVVFLVLCTVLDVAQSLAELRRVLKPGGTARVVEHVGARGATAVLQRVVQPLYGAVSGGCRLSRDTEDSFRAAGFMLDVIQRTSLGGPLWPTFAGIAHKPNPALRMVA